MARRECQQQSVRGNVRSNTSADAGFALTSNWRGAVRSWFDKLTTNGL